MSLDDIPVTSGAKARLLIVDDHALFRAGLAALFRAARDIGEVAVAAGADEAMGVALEFRPNAVVLDISLPMFGAFAAARAILGSCPDCRVLFLDDAVCEAHVHAALRVGGSGYWTKHSTFGEIAEAVRQLAAGELTFCPAVSRYLVETPGGIRFQQSTDSDVLGQLTPREIEVLVNLADGLSVRQCAERMNLSRSTVDNHKSRLMSKLDIHKSVDLAHLARREGLLERR